MFFAYKVTKYSGALQEKTYRGKNPGKRERVWENVREKFGILLTNSDFDCIESTSVRKSKRKKAFPFAFRSLIRTFAAIILECLLSDGRNTKRHSTGTGNATNIDRY